MHDGGFFFGIGDRNPDGKYDLHLNALGAFARPLHGFDIMKYFDKKQK